MKNTIVKNTASLYLMNIVKIVLPLITLPYLTRILSKDVYGTVSYVKAVMQYMQIVVDFGFILSATKDVVKTKNEKTALAAVIGDTLLAKLILSAMAFVVLILMIIRIDVLKSNALFTCLSFATVFLTCFLFDYVFRGLEEMHVITIRYVLMRGIATVLTFVFVKNDASVLWIPILDIVGSLVAIILVVCELKKRDIRVNFTGFGNAINKLKESAVYFLSSMATTTFTAMNTLLIGIALSSGEVANWSVCMQMVSAVQSCYSPITDGIYPHMVRTKDIKLIKKTAKIFMPIIVCGCVFTFVVAKYALLMLGGEKYIDATNLLRAFIPLLFFSFPAMLFGWPTLGAIGKIRETTATTMITAGLQIAGLLILYFTNNFSVIYLALLRGTTEACMFFMRFGVYWCSRREFNR